MFLHLLLKEAPQHAEACYTQLVVTCKSTQAKLSASKSIFLIKFAFANRYCRA